MPLISTAYWLLAHPAYNTVPHLSVRQSCEEIHLKINQIAPFSSRYVDVDTTIYTILALIWSMDQTIIAHLTVYFNVTRGRTRCREGYHQVTPIGKVPRRWWYISCSCSFSHDTYALLFYKWQFLRDGILNPFLNRARSPMECECLGTDPSDGFPKGGLAPNTPPSIRTSIAFLAIRSVGAFGAEAPTASAPSHNAVKEVHITLRTAETDIHFLDILNMATSSERLDRTLLASTEAIDAQRAKAGQN